MVSTKDTELYRRDVQSHGRTLSASEREKLVAPYLPPAPPKPSPTRRQPSRRKRTKTIRTFVQTQIHILVYHFIHALFSIYIRIWQTYHALINRALAILYYHHRTPGLVQKDVKGLSRVPEHLSVVVTLPREGDGGLEELMDDVGELAAWCTCAGIGMLSVYEKTGILKSYMSPLHKILNSKMTSYFGPSHLPNLHLMAPNHAPYSPSPSARASPSPGPSNSNLTPNGSSPLTLPPPTLNILLLSSHDGRSTLVDLTKTLAEMSQQRKLSPSDITTELIDAEVSETTSALLTPPNQHNNDNNISSSSANGEPDLLLIFGPYVRLDGYPPWQVRLTEIFCTGDGRGQVEYQGFLRGLWRFARAEMRFGR